MTRPKATRKAPTSGSSSSRIEAALAAIELPTPLPCPCCGEGRPIEEAMAGLPATYDGPMSGLHAGVDSSQSMGVQCYTCGLRMCRWTPDDWPAEMPKRMDVDASLAWVSRRTLRLALLAWNTRPAPVIEKG